MKALRWIALFTCAAYACGDDSAEDSGPAFEDLPALIAERVCPELESCFDARTVGRLFGEDGCEGRLAAQLEDGEFAHIQAAIEAGRVTYRAADVEACIAQVEGLGCSFVTERVFENDVCERAFEGSVELGGDCTVDAECLGRAFCLTEDQCPGTCTALLEAGEACEGDDQCQEGLSCPDELGTCAALAGPGDPCGGDVAAPCRADLLCFGEDEDTGAAGECRSYAEVFAAELDEPCDFDAGELCEPGLSCIVASITAGVPEVVCAEPVGSGEPCHFGAPSQCPDGEYCDADITTGDIEGTCRELPGAGETCIAIPGSPPCAPGLICDTDGRCHAVNRLGQPCVSDDGCASGECSDGTCRRPEVCEL